MTLVGGTQGQRDDGHMAIAGLFERFADEADVVGRAAAAAGLRDEQGRVVHVILARQHRLHHLAGDQDGRIADVVVYVLEAHVHSARVNRGQ